MMAWQADLAAQKPAGKEYDEQGDNKRPFRIRLR